MYCIENYDYHLPEELIAQSPSTKRDQSRLLRVDPRNRTLSDRFFFELPDLLASDDLLVVNDTKVVPARVFGQKETGGRVEVLVLETAHLDEEPPEGRLCLLRSFRRARLGSLLFFEGDRIRGEIREVYERGLVRISFTGKEPIGDYLEERGQVPLPPYIKRRQGHPHAAMDRERYQTVYANKEGAVAAPTAGLHFTEELIVRLREKGISLAPLTLEVGYGTFQPVKTQDIRRHQVGAERFWIPEDTARKIHDTRKRGGRVLAVGTTVVRALESVAQEDCSIPPGHGITDLLIYPGFVFRAIDGLITNFHLPRSSLIFLVSAFAGLPLIQTAYQYAVEHRYRFYSYGDAMLIL